jgi:ankyrin repeat protein
MKYIKLFENFEDYDPYELMITPPNKKGEMIIDEIRKPEPNLNIVRDLILLGANLDWQNEAGKTALHMCAIYNHPEITRMLLDAGADVNIQGNDGSTALHWCAINNRPEILGLLIDAGADKTISDNEGKLPYEFADRKEFKELLQP